MDLSPIQPFLDWLNNHPDWVAATIVIIAFLESLAIAGIVIPGVLLLFGACAIAGNGILGIWPTLGCAFAGAILGDGISFFLGKHFKENIKNLWPFRNYPHWIINGEAFFAKHGGKSIIIGRFVGPIRPVMPLVAGMLGMSPSRFISVNIFSALGWAPVYVIPGYLFGASIEHRSLLPVGIDQLILYILAIAACGYLLAKLSHWQFNTDSKVYKALHKWTERQHNVRLFWFWLADHREQQRSFPLPSILLVILCGVILAILATNLPISAFFEAQNQQIFKFFQTIKHPWFDDFFTITSYLSSSVLLLLISGILILWLSYKHYIAAAIVSIISVLLLVSSLPLISGYLQVNNNLSLTTLFFGLFSAFVAQEIHNKDRWWVYGSAIIPITLISISQLYVGNLTLTGVICSILFGLFFCGFSRVLYSRYNTRAITIDTSFYIAILLCALTAAFYVILR